MKLSDVKEFKDLAPRERAALALDFGTELRKSLRKPIARGRLPGALKAEQMGIALDSIRRLHGVAGAVPHPEAGLKAMGILKLARAEAEDFVLTRPGRKRQAAAALRKRTGEKTPHLALRQLAVGMLDGEPIPRLCAAYAYWQATGLDHAVVPILNKGLDSEDTEVFSIAAHCMGQVAPRRIQSFMGTREDDEAHSPQFPERESMTVIIHGTFSKDHEWYQPGGDFHQYIDSLYHDVYSEAEQIGELLISDLANADYLHLVFDLGTATLANAEVRLDT